MSRFQIKTRPNTINVNQNDFEKINAEINDFCDAAQVEPTSFKELFHNLLDFARFGAKNQSADQNTSEEITELQAEISALKAENDKLVNSNNELQTLNSDLFSKNVALSEAHENILLVPCTPEQKEVLNHIAENRHRKNLSTDPSKPDSPAEIIKQIAFREPYLYNHWEDYYTGL